jgi:HD-like signal output (HDOD) protein
MATEGTEMSTNLDEIANKIKEIPPMPLVAVKVIELLGDPKVTFKKLSAVIAKDQAVSARVLKMSNSSFYAPARKISSLDQAIVLLGENTLKSLVLAFSLKGISRKLGLVEKMQWEDSMGCAIGSRLVAKWFHTVEPEEAFMGGLFRHIGRVVMNNIDPEKYQMVMEEAYNGEGSIAEIEKKYFPYSHGEIGAAVLSRWNFSETMVDVVRHHEEFTGDESDDPEYLKMAATVNLADQMCQRLGIGCRMPDHDVNIADCPGAKILDVTEEQLEQLLEEFRSIFERDRDAFFG